ncbi:biopolymer transport protein ExbB [Salmonella enterica subsp. enterica]|nr:biopolymer transport protein ExbB [Salmonella enterica subsp. enterica]
MYQHADIVVKCVMIGLILASVVTWAIFFSKSVEFFTQKRRLKREQLQLADARSLDQASDIAAGFSAKSLSAQLINEAQNELELSQGSEDNEGIKERTGFPSGTSRRSGGPLHGTRQRLSGDDRRHFPLRRVVWHRMGHYE